MEPNRDNPPDGNPYVEYASREELANFIRRVYLLTIVFMTVEIVQWLVLCNNDNWNKTVRSVGLIILIIGFIALSMMNLCHQLRYTFPINWILTIVVIEATTLGVASITSCTKTQNMFYSALCAALITVTLLVFGVVCPAAILPGEWCMCLIQCGFLILFIVMFTILLVSEFAKHVRNFLVVTMVFLIPIILYHSQVIHGRRFGVPIKDYLLCAILVTIDFSIITVGVYYFLFVEAGKTRKA